MKCTLHINVIRTTAMTDEEVVENAGKCNPSEGDRRRLQKHRLKLKVPNYPKLCLLVKYYAGRAVPKAYNNSLRSSDKRLSPSTQVLPFAFPPYFFWFCSTSRRLYVFLRPFSLNCPVFGYDLKVIFVLHNSVVKVILPLIYVSE